MYLHSKEITTTNNNKKVYKYLMLMTCSNVIILNKIQSLYLAVTCFIFNLLTLTGT